MADVMLLTPGQQVAQPDWEAIFAQHGGFKSVQQRPATDAEIKAAALAGDDDPASMQAPIYRYYLNDGTYVEARTAKNGTDYAVIDYKPSQKFQQSQTQKPADDPTARNAAELQAQRERNAALPPDQDPAYETDAERRTRAQATITRQGAEAKAAEEKAERDRKEREATEEKNKPKPQQAPDGSWGYFDTKPGQQPQWVPIASAPGAAPMKPVEVNGQWGVWQPSKDGGPPTFTRVDVPQAGVTIKNVDPYTPDFNTPDLGLGAWSQAQRQKIGLPADQGGITQKDYDDAVKEAHGRAGTSITNIANANTVIRQQQIDQENIRNTRSKEAGEDFSNALGVFNQVWKYADPKTGSIRNLIPGLMGEQKRAREERTATAPTLPGLHPMFQMASAQSAATAQPPAAKEQAAGTGPTPEPYTPPGAPPQEDAAAAEAFRQQQAASAAAQAQPAAPPPPVAAPAQGPITDPRDAGVVPPPMTPPVNPAAGQPGNDPTQPVGMQPGPMTEFSRVALAPTTPAPTGGAGPMDGLMQQAAPGMTFDPFERAGLLVRSGVPPEIATQAMMAAGLMPRRMMQGAAA